MPSRATRPLRGLCATAILALAACQSSGPPVEVDETARTLTNACLAELGKPILPETVTEDASITLTEAEQTAFRDCVERRAGA